MGDEKVLAKYHSSDQITSSLIASRSSLNNPLSSSNPGGANPGSMSGFGVMGTVAIINIPDSNETLDSQAGTSNEPELAVVRISTL